MPETNLELKIPLTVDVAQIKSKLNAYLDKKQYQDIATDTSQYTKYQWVGIILILSNNSLVSFYNVANSFCTDNSCPQMNAGPTYTYFWKEGESESLALSAPVYSNRLLVWSKESITSIVSPVIDENKESDTFLTDVGLIYRRLFRLYAHLLQTHRKQFQPILLAQIQRSLFIFISVVKYYNLIPIQELAPLKEYIEIINSSQSSDIPPPINTRPTGYGYCKFNTPRNSNIYTPKKSEARTPSTPSPLKTVEKKNVDESENINDKSCCIII